MKVKRIKPKRAKYRITLNQDEIDILAGVIGEISDPGPMRPAQIYHALTDAGAAGDRFGIEDLFLKEH